MDYRLPTSVVPSRYELRLVPDLDAAVFAGEETVTVTIREPVTEIVLNAAELSIQAKHEMHWWVGRTTHRLRLADGALKMSRKKVVLINAAEPLPNLSFLI